MRLFNRRSALGLVTTALLLTACGASRARSAGAPSPRPFPSLGTSLETIPVDDARQGELHLVYDLEDPPELWVPMPDDELAASADRGRLTRVPEDNPSRIGSDLAVESGIFRLREVEHGRT